MIWRVWSALISALTFEMIAFSLTCFGSLASYTSASGCFRSRLWSTKAHHGSESILASSDVCLRQDTGTLHSSISLAQQSSLLLFLFTVSTHSFECILRPNDLWWDSHQVRILGYESVHVDVIEHRWISRR